MDFVYTVKIANSRDVEVRFDIEPWGEQYKMPPGASFTIVAGAPTRGIVEVKVEEKYITVFGWPGSIIQLYQYGTEITGSSIIPAPQTPKKLS